MAYLKHNYTEKVIKLAVENSTPGKVMHTLVEHDEWCAIWHGGYCNCDPVVKILPLAEILPLLKKQQ